MRHSKKVGAALLALAALLAVACSSNSTLNTGASPSGASTTTVGSGSIAAAQANAAKYVAVPTRITQTTPLPSKPPKKKVGFIVCPDPDCVELAAYLKDATNALGWSLVTVNQPATDPGAAIQQLVDAGVDYVAETGSDANQFQTQMAELQSRKIPLFECDDTDVPAGPTNGIYADCNDSSAATVVGRSLADWVITDSGGKANTLVVSLPAYPILTTQVNAVQAAFGQDCPTCKVSDLNVTPNDLSSGAVPQDIASYLKTHTDINYVYLVYNGLDNALTSTLQSAGLLNKVKIVGAQPGAPEVQNIIDGSEKAWLEVPRSELMWTLADQMARYSENVWSLSEERQAAVPPMYIVTTPAQAKAIIGFNLGWPGPVGYQDAFKTLWHV